MRKLLVGLAGVLAVMGMAAEASAADAGFGSQGQMVFSGDRLFGYYSWTAKAEYTPFNSSVKYESEASGTKFNFLWGSSGTTYGEMSSLVSAVPRLSFDYFVIDRLSLGGSLGYTSASGKQDVYNNNGLKTTRDSNELSAWVFAPRVGYVIPINDIFSFWPRGGFTYMSVTSTDKTGNTSQDTTLDGLQLNLEGMFAISPVPHFAFVVGPVIDWGLTGKRKEPAAPNFQNETDVKVTTIGIAAGVMGYF